jgi:hypothetical protein
LHITATVTFYPLCFQSATWLQNCPTNSRRISNLKIGSKGVQDINRLCLRVE